MRRSSEEAIDARRQHVLDAAASLVLDPEVASLTMEQLARRSSLSKPTVYKLFANADEVLHALIDRDEETLDALVAAALADETSFEGRLRALIRTYASAVGSGLGTVSDVIYRSMGTPALERRRAARLRQIVVALADIIRAEEDVSPQRSVALAVMLSSAVTSAIELWRVSDVGPEQLEEVVVPFAMAGFRAIVELEPRSP